MKQRKRAYYNENWFSFSDAVQLRDNYKCVKCGRRKGDIVLQYPVCHGRIYPSILFADLCCKNSLWQHQPGSSAAL